MPLRHAVFDRYVLFLDIAGFAQPLVERSHKRRPATSLRHGSDRPAEHPEHRGAPHLVPRRQLTEPLMDRL
jgi:hypothetical protein